MEPKWIEWAKSLQAIAQNGLNYSENEFDRERYNKIRDIASEIITSHTDLEFERIKSIFGKEEGHATPKVDVRGAVFKGDKILMVKEISDGGWTLPGGWADPNETPSASIEREVLEESGFIVKTKKIIAVYDRAKQGHVPPFPYHVYKIFFECELVGGEKSFSIETDGVEFFSQDEIPDLSIARTTLLQIKRIFEHHENPEIPTDFD